METEELKAAANKAGKKAVKVGEIWASLFKTNPGRWAMAVLIGLGFGLGAWLL